MERKLTLKDLEREKIIGEGGINKVREKFIEEIKSVNLEELLNTKPIKDILEMEKELDTERKISISIRDKIRVGLGINNF